MRERHTANGHILMMMVVAIFFLRKWLVNTLSVTSTFIFELRMDRVYNSVIEQSY
jgi:hypothetical protein